MTLDDLIDALTQSVNRANEKRALMPYKKLTDAEVNVILLGLTIAWQRAGIAVDRSQLDDHEDRLTGALRRSLLEILGDRDLPGSDGVRQLIGFVFQNADYETPAHDADGRKFKPPPVEPKEHPGSKNPDLTLSLNDPDLLYCKTHFLIHVEAMPIDSNKTGTSENYVYKKHVARFVEPEWGYSGGMRDGIMIGFVVSTKKDIVTRLGDYFKAVAGRANYIKGSGRQHRIFRDGLGTSYRSQHERFWYYEGGKSGPEPGPIEIVHLWMDVPG